MAQLTTSPAWRALEAHAAAIRERHLRTLFQDDPERFTRFQARFEDLLLDYSKHRITSETLRLLLDLARERDLEGWRRKLLEGQRSTRPKTGPSCTRPCATARARPSWSTVWTSCRRSWRC